jgi:hypothetical protein
LFHSHEDRLLYLQRFAFYLQPVLDCLAYNLLTNHSHFIVQLKDIEAMLVALKALPSNSRTRAINKLLADPLREDYVDVLIERQLNSFMTSYVNLINHTYDRKGGLFQSPFRRSLISDEIHLQQAIIYTHANAQKHGIVKDFRDYSYTSYCEVLAGFSGNVNVGKVMEIFAGKNQFIELHKIQAEHFYNNNFTSPIAERDT